jgi:hypothetical protein
MQAQLTHSVQKSVQKLSRFNNILSTVLLLIVTANSFGTLLVSTQIIQNTPVTSTVNSNSIASLNSANVLSASSQSANLNSTSSSSSFNSSSSSSSSQAANQNVSSISTPISTQIAKVATQTFVGELDRKEGNTIFVSRDNRVKQYVVNNNIKVRRDSMESSLAMLKTGDTLTVNQSQDGSRVFSIDAISKQSNDLMKWLIATIVILLIGVPAIIYILKKSKKSHIHTSTSTRE